MTSYRLPRQHARSTKRPSKFKLSKIMGKTKSVTYRFYFFVGNLPKFFNLLDSMTKSYLVVFKIHRKMAYYSLEKIVLDKFPRNLFYLKCHRERYVHAKNQDRSLRKILRSRQLFSAGFISVSRDFTPYFHFRCVASATF